MADHKGSVVLVEPFGAGGGPDLVGRVLAERLTPVWGVPVTVDNRPGAGATAAPAFVAAAPPDGRTVLLSTSAHAYSAAFAQELPYDPEHDFVAIAAVSSQPYVLVAPATSGMRTLADLVAEAHGRPGALRFASMGVGTGTHLGVEQLNADLGVSARHAPPGPADAIADTIARLVAGAADYALAPISMAEPQFSAGTLVPLGVSGDKRSRLLPGVPTLAEAGAVDFDFPIWYGTWAPAATPPTIVSRLAAGIAEAVATPAVRAAFGEHGADPMEMTQREFADFAAGEATRARRIAEAASPKP